MDYIFLANAVLLAFPLLLLGVLLAGKSGWVKSGADSYPFRTWRLRLSCSPIDTTSFIDGGFSTFMAGFITGELTASGFLDTLLQLQVGDSYTLSLGAGAPAAGGGTYSISFTGVLLDLTASTAVDKAAEIEISMRTNGAFDTSFAVA